MNVPQITAIATLATICLVSCQGGFSSGTAEPNSILPPQAPQAVSSTPSTTGTPSTTTMSGMVSRAATPASSEVAAYSFSQAPQGLQCPKSQGFTCLLQLNVPGKTSKHKRKITTPVPSSSPHAATVTLQLVALPNDAPSMAPQPRSTATASPTTALMAVRLHTDADVQLNGPAIAQFILPKEQFTKRRGFAIQFFREVVESRTSHLDKFVGSYSTSSIKDTALRFAFTPPPVTIKKDDLWLIVLYGDGSSATPAPIGTASTAPTGPPSTAPTGPPSTAPTSVPTATP